MISIVHYLYRNSVRWAIAVVLGGLLLGARCEAQLRDRTQPQEAPEQNQSKINAKKEKRGPRAIAVLEFLPGNGTRLVPVALWIDGHYNDASLYGANPEPMALEGGTVYQVLNTGEATGWFTVTAPRQDNGNWIADGQFKPRRALDEQIAERAAKQPKGKAPSLANDDQGPPVLRRSGSSSSDSSSSSGSAGGSARSGNAPPPGDDDPDRPTLKAPKPSAPATATTNPSSGKQVDSAASANAGSSSAADDNDPERPSLRRGKQPAGQVASASAPAPSGVAKPSAKVAASGMDSAALAAPPGQGPRSYPAISDAGNVEARSLLYALSESEREKQTVAMTALAMAELQKFSKQHKLPAPPNSAALSDSDLRAFDLDYSNSPTLVLSGKLSVANPKEHAGSSTYFVTVVAREDINGTPQKIFASVTANNYLDAFPRMQIVDALDADANGRGDLLFRQYSDTGISYALFRVYPYQLVKIFEGGASM